jgi:hypothetical protein
MRTSRETERRKSLPWLRRMKEVDQIFREMQAIRLQLNSLENRIAGSNAQPEEMSESELIFLPNHLRRTYMVVVSKGECSVMQVSNFTGRCRAIESRYLNQLFRMGWLNKCRASKVTYFQAVSQKTLKEPPEDKSEKPDFTSTL